MKILYLLGKPFGRMGTAASYMVPMLVAENGHHVKVVAHSSNCDHNGAPNVQLVSGVANNFELLEISPNLPQIKESYLVSRLIKADPPDIVHIFFQRRPFLYPLFIKNVFRKGRKAKWLLDIRSPRIFTRRIQRLKYNLYRPFVQLGFDGFMGHVLPSILDALGKPRKSYKVVPLGVDNSLFANKKAEHNSLYAEKKFIRTKRFLYVGSINKTRQLECLVQSIILARKKIPAEERFFVDFFGHGDAVSCLENKVKEAGLSETIRFRGIRAQKELFKKMKGYDAGFSFIPHEIYENAPALKTLEYMAAGLFVIGSNTSGNRMFVQNEENGLLVENNSEAFCKVIVQGIKTGFPGDYRKKARQCALQYDWLTIVKEHLLPFYEQLAGND